MTAAAPPDGPDRPIRKQDLARAYREIRRLIAVCWAWLVSAPRSTPEDRPR
jgi:hypothetical protein